MLPTQVIVLSAIFLGCGVAIVWIISTMQRRRRVLDEDAGLLADCIRMLVESEQPQKPFSDRALARLLTAEFGMPIRKRDVINLRRMMGISGPDKRRRAD
jgi:DNA-directed RNA polymerase specialized sigma54-like protein